MAPNAVTTARGYLDSVAIMSFIFTWVVLNSWWWQGEGDPCANELVLAVGYSGSLALKGCHIHGADKVIPGTDVTWSDVCNHNTTSMNHACSVVALASAIHLTGACIACVPFALFVVVGLALYVARPVPPLEDDSWQMQTFHMSRIAVQIILLSVSGACVAIMTELDTKTFPFQFAEKQELPVGTGFWLTLSVLVLSGVGLVLELFCALVVWKHSITPNKDRVSNLRGSIA